jgi:hypothetical protein
MTNEFFAAVKDKKIRRTDWSNDEYFVPFRLIFHKDPHEKNSRYYMLGQYYLNEIEFIVCEQEIHKGFTPDKYGTAWELYAGDKEYDYSKTH